jgi:arylsulfatase A-like enzyme
VSKGSGWKVAAAVGVVSILAYGKGLPLLKLYGPGLLADWRDPVGPPRPVSWDQGPATPAAPVGKRPPNVVVIVADDLGANDLTYAGGGVADGAVPTPNIDSIAHEGVTLTAGYAANATCAPSRAAIMTGRTPTRFGFEFTPAPKAFMRLVAGFETSTMRPSLYFTDREKDVPSMDLEGLPPSEITAAELLKARGYHTVALGKWHLGEASAMRPGAQGFDEFLGFLPGAAMYLPKDDPSGVGAIQDFDPIDPFLWANLRAAVRQNTGSRFQPGAYMTDYLADAAVEAIGASRNRPFFLYLAFNAPHTPLQALRTDYDALPQIGPHPLRVYAAMIRALDRGVGRVLEALRANGLERDTLVIFTSDNGGAHYIGLPDINRPYRGWKMTFFEGGVHTPFFMKWPATLPQGARYAEAVGHVDIFATAAGAAGVALPRDRPMDGVDLIPFLTGAAQGAPHRALFWRSGHYEGVRAGDWKLQVSVRPPKTWLFDLATDPTEKTNLADSRPEKVAELRALLVAHDAETVKPAWPALIEAPVPIDRPLGVTEAADDEYVYWAN